MSTEVRSQAKHRTFSAADKARILSEYEAAETPLERAAILRRSAVYSSLLSNWRKELATGQPASKRGRPANPQATEIVQLRKENERVQRRLAKCEHVVAALGKAHALLQMIARESAPDEERSSKS